MSHRYHRPRHVHHDPLENVGDWPAFFTQVRKNPATFLGHASIFALRDVLMGFGLAEIVYNVPADIILDGFDIHAFERWCDQRYNPAEEPLHSFDLAHRAAEQDVTKALDIWFDWVDTYLAES